MDFDAQLAFGRAHEADFVGLLEDEAQQLAARLCLTLRVHYSDDDPLTLELRASRMTVEVRSGRVVQAHAG